VTSEKKRLANARNAQKSTGPRTTRGKSISSKNAKKHGLLSRDILAPEEDGGELQALRETIVLEIAPVGTLEEILAEKIVAGFWRLARMSRVEAELFLDEMFARDINAAAAQAASYVSTRSILDLPPMTETRITNEEEYKRAIQRREAAASKREETILGQTFAKCAAEGDVFSKLARYETSIERSIFRWLHELQELQASRSGRETDAVFSVDTEVPE
jgi:hypothetical protein